MNDFSVTIVDNWRDVTELSGEWNELLSASLNDSLFLRWEWIDTWWRHYGFTVRPYVVVVRDAGGLIQGIAPLMLRNCPGTLGLIKSLQIIGHKSDVYPEYLDWIVRKTAVEQTVSLIGSVLLARRNSDWHVLDFHLVPETSPLLGLIEKWPSTHGGRISNLRKESPYLTLPSTVEEFMQIRGSNFRKRWRKKNNALAKVGTVRLAIAGCDIPVADAMTYLIELNRKRWGAEGRSFRSRMFIDFHRELSQRLVADNKVHLVVMYVDDRPVAARYDFVHNNKFWGYQSGWAPEWRDYSVSYILLGLVLEWGIRQGLSEYDFLAGNSEYKSRWAENCRYLVNMSYCSPGVKGTAWCLLKEAWAGLSTVVPARLKYLVNRESEIKEESSRERAE